MESSDIEMTGVSDSFSKSSNEYAIATGDKRYELSNHLGNVLSVVSDEKLVSSQGGFIPNVLSYSDYYPFGMLMPNRNYSGRFRKHKTP